jgi:hypothetical protein
MSTELVIRIWADKRISARTQLLDLIKIFEFKGFNQGSWKGLTVRESDLSKKTLQLQEPLSWEQINTALAKYDSDDLHLSVRSAFPCWRFDGTTPQDEFVPLWIEAWGNNFVNSTGRCREVEGDAAISLANSGPFVALIESEETPQLRQVNQYIEKNLERVTDLILAIAEQVNPVTMKAFTAQGLYQPLNAHLVFFRDQTVLLNDLIFIKKLWDEGLPGYRTPPLRESVDKPDLYTLHPWRGLEASQTLSNRLSCLINNIDYLTPTDLEQIDWQHYDNYEGENGRVVLDYPYWVNSFLDHFYIALLSTNVKK